MKKILLLIPIITLAQESSLTYTILDNYHITISKWIMDKSDAIDKYLSGSDDSKNLSNTKIKLSYEIGSNNKGRFSNSFDFALSLSLPRTQNKAKIILEKVIESKSLIGNREAQLSKSDLDKNVDNYNLALNLSGINGKKFSVKNSSGIRFNKYFIEPYVGISMNYNLKHTKRVESNIKNTLRYYISGELRDVLSSQYLYKYRKDILLGWFGDISYTSASQNQYLTSEFIWHKTINDYKFYRLGFIANAKLTNFQNFRKNDFEIYFKYHDKVRDKDWLSYEVTPFVDLKRRDNYHVTYGFKVKVSATFGGLKDLLTIKK